MSLLSKLPLFLERPIRTPSEIFLFLKHNLTQPLFLDEINVSSLLHANKRRVKDANGKAYVRAMIPCMPQPFSVVTLTLSNLFFISISKFTITQWFFSSSSIFSNLYICMLPLNIKTQNSHSNPLAVSTSEWLSDAATVINIIPTHPPILWCSTISKRFVLLVNLKIANCYVGFNCC